MRERSVRADLPVHPGPALDPGPGTIRVDGRVRRSLDLSVADLDLLTQRVLVDDFTCVEGWSVPGLVWKGIPLAAILELASVEQEVRWIQASAGGYSVPLPLEDARRALLARWLGERRVPTMHGGPVRLIVPGRECFTSVKWLDHLEARVDPLPDSARALALGRLRRPAGQSGEVEAAPPPVLAL